MLTNITFGLSALLFTFAVGTQITAEELYRKAESLYQQQQFSQANDYFQKVTATLQARQAKFKQASMPWNLLEFGQINALYRMSQIARKRKQMRLSCRLYQQTMSRLNKLPQGWENWQVQEQARKRLQSAKNNFAARCDSVPTLLQLNYLPTHATVEQRTKGKWVPVKAQATPGKRKLLLVQTPGLQLRFSADGYLPQETTLTLSRWSEKTISISLKQKPKARVVAVVRPRVVAPPPKPVITPIHQKGWFWAVIGIGGAAVIGGVIAGVVVSQQPYTEVLRDNPNQPGFTIWK